tara:strand:+ start:455 stop:1135 length:681 start_codon:yes stop_codon:yes gene_type:complete
VRVQIAPSILSADFTELGKAVRAAERGGADAIHVDVMDGHFVPNLSIGPPVISSIKRTARVPLDVHLMIEDPSRYLEAFAKAGADTLSIHVEAQPNLSQALTSIKKLGLLAGAALNPSTPVTALETVVSEVDVVLVMSVNPGFGGQRFIPSSIEKVRAMRALLESAGNPAPIAVDGGVDLSNAGELVAAGANILVAGSAIFGQDDPTKATRALRAASEEQAVREPN